jgi:hypothetical protein
MFDAVPRADAANRRHLNCPILLNPCNNFRLRPLTPEILK